ncbi:Lipoprotein LprG precursor [Actinomadura rubteroloni]|uniref:Lipoprotein LprG n=1 Tax=Actinomadura rubteroloni TaxID=1926885 RepID=A0A2P4UGN8_9ACTN|nr:LppX_LprAFG lipoprotein [Actinomadura rubteroloni]POM24233.1 Lipoprotein LprG precursor [Actinomadura rubteroloni]
MSRLRSRFTGAAALLISLVTVTSCSGGGDGGNGTANEPDGSGTLRQAAQTMSGLSSIGFKLTTDGEPQVIVRGGEMKLLKSGDADGTLQIAQSSQVVEMRIVSVGQSFYLKAVTGGWRTVPKTMAATLYDPSAVLDPNRGLAKLLTSVAGPKVEGTEKVNGEQAHRVRGTLPKGVLAGLIPGIDKDVTGKVWIGDGTHRLLRVTGDLPGAKGGTGKLTIDFTEFDKPYKFSAPK